MNFIFKSTLSIVLITLSLACFGQDSTDVSQIYYTFSDKEQDRVNDGVFLYRRGSIYSLMISQPTRQFAKEIEDAFTNMPVPDRYYDHSIGKKVFQTTDKLNIKKLNKHQGFIINDTINPKEMNAIDMFLFKQEVASRLVAKWFQRKRKDGICNVNLIQERGFHNASEAERRFAESTIRKEAILRDAGEELIGSTFVLVNDISYYDKSEGSAIAGAVANVAVSTLGVVTGETDLIGSDVVGNIISSAKGFNVKIKTYLYQLVWDEDIAGFFYTQIYSEEPNAQKKTNFENNRGKFSLKFIGMQESSGTNTSFLGINEDQPELMVRKACQRALDENVANLQKNFECFQIKAPLSSVTPLRSEIGLKEGVSESSRFEVLEAVEDEVGHITYKRVGIIKPQKGQIWDNRFMAKEEGAPNAELGYSTFDKVSGSNFVQGSLIREIK